MYDELVKRLRAAKAVVFKTEDVTLLGDAADAIEELQKRVPKRPHGRLIDADTLVERIDGIWDCNDMVFKPNDKICKIPEDCKGCKWEQTKDCIQRMVENAPTIIPAEEGET